MFAVVCVAVPNVSAFIWPHSLFANGLLRSQSGTKLLLASVQPRAVVVAMRPIGLDNV